MAGRLRAAAAAAAAAATWWLPGIIVPGGREAMLVGCRAAAMLNCGGAAET